MPELVDMLRLSRHGRFSAKAAEYTAIDFETTGLHPGHIVEIAAVRIRANGTVLGELSTLVNPGRGIGPGPTHIHQITREQLDDAPSLGDVLGEFVDLCRGSVVVAHNLPFEKRFLAEELTRLGVRMPALPGVCTLSSSRHALRLPNYRLATVAGAIGIDEYAAHTALADAQVCAHLVSSLVMTHGLTFERQPRFLELPTFGRGPRTAPREEALPAAPTGWMAQLVDRLPTAAVVAAEEAVEDAYLEMLTDALADQHISAGESRALVALAADAGLSEEDVLRVHKGFVSAMRTVAEADGIVTAAEERDLRQVADALGVPEMLADLRLTDALSSPVARRVLVLGRTAEADELRAEVLAAGIQLAKKLTASVSHLAVGRDISTAEPRRARARELGAEVLDFPAARAVLGLVPETAPATAEEQTIVIPMAVPEPVPLPVVVLTPSSQFRIPPPAPTVNPAGLRAGRVLMGLGLLIMLGTVIALFGGSGVGAGVVLAVVGVGTLVGGWYLTSRRSAAPRERSMGLRPPVHQDF
jgi:DNA polymerase-3 subunit epsilon